MGHTCSLSKPCSNRALFGRIEAMCVRSRIWALALLASCGGSGGDDDDFVVPDARPGSVDALSSIDPWNHLDRFLKTGEVLPIIDVDERGRGATYSSVVLRLGRRFMPFARQLATYLRPVDTVLDVGAGSGIWSLAMAERSPKAQ